MKTGKLIAGALALTIAACAQAPKPLATIAAPVPVASAPPQPLASPAEPALGPAIVVMAQRNLRTLGYAVGKPGDMADPALRRAILEFEGDQRLAEDGRLSLAVMDRLKAVRAALAKSAAANDNRSAIFIYSDGSVGRQAQGLLIPPPKGLVSDAPVKFLQPLKPSGQASYRLGHRAKDGSVSPDITVSCRVGRMVQINVPLGSLDAVAVDCQGDGGAANPLQWRSLYSPVLGTVVRQETQAGARDLVAIRPLTGDWPSAARTGLDWALIYALEAPAASAPVEWSSTAVTPHFEIKASAKLSGQEAGLSGRYASASCRRFETVQTGKPPARYPGIACQNADGIWSLPGSTIRLATPVSGIRTQPSSPTLRKAQN